MSVACFLAEVVELLEEDDFKFCKPFGRMCFFWRPHMSMNFGDDSPSNVCRVYVDSERKDSSTSSTRECCNVE